MTLSEVEILLKAIGAVREDVRALDQKLDQFRAYADLTYVRKDNVEAEKDTREIIWKKRDRILARISVLLSAAAVLVALFSFLQK
jgi:hypothetical protein